MLDVPNLWPLALAAAVLAATVGRARAGAGGRHGPQMTFDAFRALCERWSQIWAIPPVLLLTIGTIESDRHPRETNVDDPRAAARGGAWGLFQVTWATAKDELARLKAMTGHLQPGTYLDAISLFDGTPESLLDPNLNALIAGHVLASHSKRFAGNFTNVVAAYHQGAGKVSELLAAGKVIPDDLPPHGKAYVQKALAVRRELEAGGVA